MRDPAPNGPLLAARRQEPTGPLRASRIGIGKGATSRLDRDARRIFEPMFSALLAASTTRSA
jgi:hypothetical protein